MKNNVLELEARGCNFFEGDEINKLSDVGNYRVGIYNKQIKAKNGKAYTLEFTRWEKYNYRTTHKITGKPLKHEVKELVNKNALYLNTEFEQFNKQCGYNASYRDVALEKQIHAKNYNFTKADILKVINEISIKQYTDIIIK